MLKHLNLIVTACLMLTAGQAFAQADVSEAPATQQWIPMVVGMLMVIAVVAISFWTSRRGHQD